MTVTLIKLDVRWFPLLCCGRSWSNCRAYMDHALPSHMLAVVSPPPLPRRSRGGATSGPNVPDSG